MLCDIQKTIFNEKYGFTKSLQHRCYCNQRPHMHRTSRRRTINEDVDGILKQYPSLKKKYEKELQDFVDVYLKHKSYFHNNIFEELMAKVWHYDNIDKFNDWDPE
jgi:nitric oxide reductase activation protein